MGVISVYILSANPFIYPQRIEDCLSALSVFSVISVRQKELIIQKEKTDRNEILIEAIQYGAPLRQLSRLTGISYGVIQRINDKMKLGQ